MSIKSILNTSFAKNVLTLVSGTTIAQIIPIAIIPILTRLYSPEDFGLVAVFTSITAILGVIANGRYELAIVLPKSEKDAVNIFFLGLLVCTLFSSALFVIILTFSEDIYRLVSVDGFESIILYIPLMVWFIGFYSLMNYMLTRVKAYKKIAITTVAKSSFMGGAQVFLGYLSFGGVGLVISQFVFQLVGNIYLIRFLIKKFDIRNVSFSLAVKNAIKYINFPKFSLPAALANTASQHVSNLLISSFFSVATLGFYSLAQKVLGLPSSFIGGAVFQVFYQEAVEEKNRTGKVIQSFDSTLKKLFIIAIPFYVLCYFFVEDVFSLVFGPEWLVAGTFCKIALPMFAIRFVISSISAVDSVMEKQNYFMWFNIVLLAISLLVVYLARDFSFELFLTYYTYTTVLIYSLYGFILRKMAKGELR